MRLVLALLPKMFVMAAIVNTALFFPFGALLAFLSFILFGVSLQAFVTFGSVLAAPLGVIAWWMLLLVPSLLYSAFVMPWIDE